MCIKIEQWESAERVMSTFCVHVCVYKRVFQGDNPMQCQVAKWLMEHDVAPSKKRNTVICTKGGIIHLKRLPLEDQSTEAAAARWVGLQQNHVFDSTLCPSPGPSVLGTCGFREHIDERGVVIVVYGDSCKNETYLANNFVMLIKKKWKHNCTEGLLNTQWRENFRVTHRSFQKLCGFIKVLWASGREQHEHQFHSRWWRILTYFFYMGPSSHRDCREWVVGQVCKASRMSVYTCKRQTGLSCMGSQRGYNSGVQD